MDPHDHPFLVIALIAVQAPFVSELPMHCRIPNVVLETTCGVLVGLQVLNWVLASAVSVRARVWGRDLLALAF